MSSRWVVSGDEMTTVQMVFARWMRTRASAEDVIIGNLVGIVSNYFCISQFEWDQNPLRRYEGVNLWDKNTTLKYVQKTEGPDSNQWKTVISKHALSSRYIKFAQWEITLKEVGKGGVNLVIGFVPSSDVNLVRLDRILGQMDRPKECAFGIIKSTNGFHRIEAGTWPRYNSNWRSNDCKDGDKVLLHFDFVH